MAKVGLIKGTKPTYAKLVDKSVYAEAQKRLAGMKK